MEPFNQAHQQILEDRQFQTRWFWHRKIEDKFRLKFDQCLAANFTPQKIFSYFYAIQRLPLATRL